jgi:alginate O-acetyltransferase complex protein AlgI
VLFNTLAYAKFFAVVFVVSWGLGRVRRVRLAFLLAASYFFYAAYDWRFLPLLWLSSSLDWLLGAAIARARDVRQRTLWLTATVVMNLGVLAIFKYWNFGVDSVRGVLGAFGYHPPEFGLHVVLPIGISFFTFESMSYVIDVYRGDIEPHESYLEYLSFVAFFPHLVAGPIVRPRDLLPQLAAEPRWNGPEASGALLLIALGLLKKVAIGDYLALNLVDRVFDAPTQYSALECYVAVVAYAVQIYSDFSGYTDIAIGSAALLGIRFPKNFDAPYLALDISEFWRRWHISLSTWLRDYLYIPLGGNRRGAARTYVNLLLTMLLGGLWHGIYLALHRFFRERLGFAPPRTLLGRVLLTGVTFHLVLVAWVFFRSESFGAARILFSQLLTHTTYHPNLDPRVLAVLVVGFGLQCLRAHSQIAVRDAFARLPALAQGAVLFVLLLCVRRMASSTAVPFLYFQF